MLAFTWGVDTSYQVINIDKGVICVWFITSIDIYSYLVVLLCRGIGSLCRVYRQYQYIIFAEIKCFIM